MLRAPLITDYLIERQHRFHVLHWFALPCCGRPSQTVASLLYVHFLALVGVLEVKLGSNLLVVTLFSHPERDWSTLLLDHSQVFVVLMSVEEEFTRVKLDKDASHRPNIRSFVPHKVLKDNLRRSILPRVNDQRVPLIVIGRPAKVDHLNLCVQWFEPNSLTRLLRLCRLFGGREMCTIVLAVRLAFLTAEYLPFHSHLNR